MLNRFSYSKNMANFVAFVLGHFIKYKLLISEECSRSCFFTCYIHEKSSRNWSFLVHSQHPILAVSIYRKTNKYTISFFSCVNNARFQIHPDRRIVVTALRDIPKGTEITTKYMPCTFGKYICDMPLKKGLVHVKNTGWFFLYLHTKINNN